MECKTLYSLKNKEIKMSSAAAVVIALYGFNYIYRGSNTSGHEIYKTSFWRVS